MSPVDRRALAAYRARQLREYEARVARDRALILPKLPELITVRAAGLICRDTPGYRFTQGISVTQRLAACGAIVRLPDGVCARNSRPQKLWKRAS